MECLKLWGAPGTGKTTRLIHEINELLNNGYTKDDFVITTFRRQMADELKTRLGWNNKEGIINTIHGVCRSLAGINSVVDNKHRADFCNSVNLTYTKPDGGKYDQEPGMVYSNKPGNLFFDALSFLINNQLDFSQINRYAEYKKLESSVVDPETFMKTTAELWSTWKKDNNLHDFDDMLTVVYQNKICPSARVLVVDEFQDLTPLQYKIVCMWEEQMERVLIAGDPRQSIYGFWGADSQYFENHEGSQVVLPVSYRLPPNVWSYARKVLEKAGLKAPDIRTEKKAGVLKKVNANAYYERLKSFRENTFHLVRTNEMGRNVAQSLATAGIPFNGIAGWGKKQILLYNVILKVRMNLAGNKVPITPDELDSLIEAYPKKFFSRKKTDMRKWLVKINNPLQFSDIEEIATRDNYNKLGLWDQLAGDGALEDTLGGLSQHDNMGRLKILSALKNNKDIITTPSVIVQTIHASKGGEADYVFLHDSITKKIHEKLYSDNDTSTIKTEAQTFYVGVTRACQALFIVESADEFYYILPEVVE